MAKKKNKQKFDSRWLLAIGAAVVVFGGQLFDKVVADVANNIAFSVKKVRLKFSGALLTIPLINVKVPQNLDVFTMVTIQNDNPVGAKIHSVDLTVSYGQGGGVLAPVISQSFTVPANGGVDVEFLSRLDFTKAPQQLGKVFTQFKNGELRKLWVSGTVFTNLGPMDINQEATVFEA